MERLRFEIPSIEHKTQAIEYIQEHHYYNSNINGSGGLHRYIENYEGWLEKLEQDRICEPTEEKVPGETYFLIRENDNRIVGMINIRYVLNEKLRKSGGHIGYGIRPTERQKGYNKVNLYLGLLRCEQLGMEDVILDCDKENVASARTMQALGGVLQSECYDEQEETIVCRYKINVGNSINDYKEVYESKISIK